MTPATAASLLADAGHAIEWMDGVSLAAAFARRDLSPVEVVRCLLDRIETLDPAINAMVHIDRATTLAMAADAERRYGRSAPLTPLDGVPVTVKDLSAVAGWPRRRGSLTLRDTPPSTDDTPCVARLREAGAVFLGKTATPEAGCRIVTHSRMHGVTRNPYDVSRTPGGSSGGAAAALAAGFGPLAVGSDGAGSIRIPASFTNTVGLKPGFGRVPAFPPDVDMPHSVVGPMTRTVRDAALMLEIMSRPEPRDPFMWPIPFAARLDRLDGDASGLRVALSPRMGCLTPLVDDEIDGFIRLAAVYLAQAGATVSDESPQWPVDPHEPFRLFWELACLATVDQTPPEQRALLDPLLIEVGAAGARRKASEIIRAQTERLAIATTAKAFFANFDLLLAPVMPIAAWEIGRDVPHGFASDDWSWCPYTYPWNMTGQPAASVPIGFTSRGLPVGVQIVGRVGDEHSILRAAAAIEARSETATSPRLTSTK